MNLLLNVYKLNNEDVITTSGLTCADVYGVIQYNADNSSWVAWQNNYKSDGPSGNKYTSGLTIINSPSVSGFYHFSISGTTITIGEKCLHQNFSDAHEAHNVDDCK